MVQLFQTKKNPIYRCEVGNSKWARWHPYPPYGWVRRTCAGLGREGWCIPGLDLISIAVFPIKGWGFSDHCHGPWQILLIQMQSLHAASLILEVTSS